MEIPRENSFVYPYFSDDFTRLVYELAGHSRRVIKWGVRNEGLVFRMKMTSFCVQEISKLSLCLSFIMIGLDR